MAVDRSVRNLSAMEGASSSRVLNLVAIAEANADNEGHHTAPLFLSNVLNHSQLVTFFQDFTKGLTAELELAA